MSLGSRYDRQIKLSQIGIEGQKKLSGASVLIVGVGGLGCPASQYLVAAGVGHVGLMDHDRVDETNLHRQILFSERQIGQFKVLAAQETLSQLNSSTQIKVYPEKLDEKNAIRLFKEYDIVLDGTDNFQTKYLINDACIQTDTPFVGASVYKFQGQLSVFNYQKGPSYRCLYPEHHWKDHNNCEEAGVLGVLPGLMGTMQAAEVLKMVLEIGTVLSGQLKIVDILTMQEQLIHFRRNEDEISRILNGPIELEQINCDVLDKAKLYLDVREPFEQPVPSNVRLLRISMNELKVRFREIPKNEPVYVFCQSGIRSKKAVALLQKEFEFNNLVDAGGIENLIP